jgi:hypothetical protein
VQKFYKNGGGGKGVLALGEGGGARVVPTFQTAVKKLVKIKTVQEIK